MPERARADAVYCGVVCRKRAWRFQRAVPAGGREAGRVPAAGRQDASPRSPGPLRLAYADPPYPGKAGYYKDQPTYGGEVDHASLVDRLMAEAPDGWALSTSAAALQHVLGLCPDGTRVASWHRRVRYTRSAWALSSWEPLLVYGGRPLPTDRTQDLLDVLETADVELSLQELEDFLAYRGRYGSFPGALVGMKPPEFAVWMFRLLGAGPGDDLLDLFPGSGAVARAWDLYVSPVDERRVVPPDVEEDGNLLLRFASRAAGAPGREEGAAPAAGGHPGRPVEATGAA